MKAEKLPTMNPALVRAQLRTGASAAGRPMARLELLAEDFSLLIRRRRLRIDRGQIFLLH